MGTTAHFRLSASQLPKQNPEKIGLGNMIAPRKRKFDAINQVLLCSYEFSRFYAGLRTEGGAGGGG